MKGIVTLVSFTCQWSQFAADRPLRNQGLAPVPIGPKRPRNRLYSANVTMPTGIVASLRPPKVPNSRLWRPILAPVSGRYFAMSRIFRPALEETGSVRAETGSFPAGAFVRQRPRR